MVRGIQMKVLASNMLQSQNTQSIYFSKEDKQKEGNGKQIKNKTIYAGDLNLKDQQDNIAKKKVNAQKKAMRTILEQFKRDKSIADGITTRRDHQQELLEKAGAIQEEIRNIQDLREKLKESYGISDDSDEQKNLKLLEKSMDFKQKLTSDEKEQLIKIGPLTDYQKKALEFDSMEDIWKERANSAIQGITNESRTIVSIKLAQLKTQPMTDAQKEAAKIMEAANKEIIGMLVQQTKEHVDEEIEKNEEKAEEKLEKQENSVNQGEKKDQIDNTDQFQKLAKQQDEILLELKYILQKEIIIEDDVKGIIIDEQV
ncbi:MAG: hypothetical protein K0R15_1090 [Clostridiales bacterium]|jgi:hypothetical protein|nr:hypothetical protein [Clostridiales bacterium]